MSFACSLNAFEEQTHNDWKSLKTVFIDIAPEEHNIDLQDKFSKEIDIGCFLMNELVFSIPKRSIFIKVFELKK